MVLSTVGCDQLGGVHQRLAIEMAKPGYDPAVQNCEQFARFVVEGKGYSTQVREFVVVAGLLTVLAVVFGQHRGRA